MRADEYRLLAECVERGVNWGWQHAHKHVDSPGEWDIKNRITDDVLNEICEAFRFQDDLEEQVIDLVREGVERGIKTNQERSSY